MSGTLRVNNRTNMTEITHLEAEGKEYKTEVLDSQDVWERGEELAEGERYRDIGKTIGASEGKGTSLCLSSKKWQYNSWTTHI